jgi:hypothetical protein
MKKLGVLGFMFMLSAGAMENHVISILLLISAILSWLPLVIKENVELEEVTSVVNNLYKILGKFKLDVAVWRIVKRRTKRMRKGLRKIVLYWHQLPRSP